MTRRFPTEKKSLNAANAESGCFKAGKIGTLLFGKYKEAVDSSHRGAMRAKAVQDSIICFGDSLTQQAVSPNGFVTSLQNAYQRRLDVVVRGFSGYTSRQGLALCPKLFDSDSAEVGKAVLATVWLGTNDAISPGQSQYVAEDEFKANMTRILKEYCSNTPILLITPTTVVPNMFNGHENDSRHALYGDILGKVASDVNAHRQTNGDKEKVFLVDMRTAFLNEANGKIDALKLLFQDDGLHISEKGYQVVTKTLQSCIAQNLPHLLPENLPYVFPDWKSLNLSADAKGQSEQLKPVYEKQ